MIDSNPILHGFLRVTAVAVCTLAGGSLAGRLLANETQAVTPAVAPIDNQQQLVVSDLHATGATIEDQATAQPARSRARVVASDDADQAAAERTAANIATLRAFWGDEADTVIAELERQRMGPERVGRIPDWQAARPMHEEFARLTDPMWFFRNYHNRLDWARTDRGAEGATSLAGVPGYDLDYLAGRVSGIGAHQLSPEHLDQVLAAIELQHLELDGLIRSFLTMAEQRLVENLASGRVVRQPIAVRHQDRGDGLGILYGYQTRLNGWAVINQIHRDDMPELAAIYDRIEELKLQRDSIVTELLQGFVAQS